MSTKPKKKFSETKVGKFWTDKVPSIVGLVGNALPDAGVLLSLIHISEPTRPY